MKTRNGGIAHHGRKESTNTSFNKGKQKLPSVSATLDISPYIRCIVLRGCILVLGSQKCEIRQLKANVWRDTYLHMCTYTCCKNMTEDDSNRHPTAVYVDAVHQASSLGSGFCSLYENCLGAI